MNLTDLHAALLRCPGDCAVLAQVLADVLEEHGLTVCSSFARTAAAVSAQLPYLKAVTPVNFLHRADGERCFLHARLLIAGGVRLTAFVKQASAFPPPGQFQPFNPLALAGLDMRCRSNSCDMAPERGFFLRVQLATTPNQAVCEFCELAGEINEPR